MSVDHDLVTMHDAFVAAREIELTARCRFMRDLARELMRGRWPTQAAMAADLRISATTASRYITVGKLVLEGADEVTAMAIYACMHDPKAASGTRPAAYVRRLAPGQGQAVAELILQEMHANRRRRQR